MRAARIEEAVMRDFVCDGTCSGDEQGDCSHPKPRVFRREAALILCPRCGLLVSPGICAEQPHVFHTREKHCIDALKAELSRVRKEHNEEMREAQRDCARAYSEGRVEGGTAGRPK